MIEHQLIVAHAGAMSCRIEISDPSAHASRFLMGDNALDHYLAAHTVLRDGERALNEAERPRSCAASSGPTPRA